MPILLASTDISIEAIEQEIDLIITKTDSQQPKAFSKRLAVAFIAGSNSITSTICSVNPELTEIQAEQVVTFVKGYLKKY